MSMLYVDEQGAGLRLTGRRLQVVVDDEVLRTVRLRDVEAIVGGAEGLVEPTDSLRLYALRADCAERIRSLGREAPLEADDLVVV